MATLVLGAAGAAIGGSIGGAILGVSAATIGGFIGSTIGSVVDSWIISSLAPTQRIEGARLDTLAHHLGHRGRGHPAALRPHADRRQHHLGDRFPRGDEDHHAGRRQGRRGRQGQDDRVSVLRQLRRRARARGRSPASGASGPTASRWTSPASPGAGIRATRRRRRTRSSRRRWARPTRPPIAAPPMWSSRNWRSRPTATACRSSPSRCSARSPIPTPPRG